jgi:hypothetical protein
MAGHWCWVSLVQYQLIMGMSVYHLFMQYKIFPIDFFFSVHKV